MNYLFYSDEKKPAQKESDESIGHFIRDGVELGRLHGKTYLSNQSVAGRFAAVTIQVPASKFSSRKS